MFWSSTAIIQMFYVGHFGSGLWLWLTYFFLSHCPSPAVYLTCATFRHDIKNTDGIAPTPEKSTELSNLQRANSVQRNQVISVRGWHDNGQHVSVIAAIFRRTGCTQIMTDAAAARCVVLVSSNVHIFFVFEGRI